MKSLPHHKSPLCQIWWPLALQKMRCFVFNLSCDLMCPCGQRVPLIINIHPAKFSGHRHCAREEISFFICHVTSREFMVRESCDIMDEFPSLLVTTLQSLMIIDLLEEEILSFQYVTWLQMITWSEVHVKSWMSFPHHKSPHC